MGKTNSGEFVSIKEYIDGDFILIIFILKVHKE